MLTNFYTLTGEAAATGAEAGAAGGTWTSIIMIIAMVAIFYFIGIRPQKKQEKQANDMRNSLMVGDEITTIGGIVGKISNIREEVLIIETGSDRTKMKIARWAVRSVEKKAGEETEKKAATYKLNQ